MLRKFLLAGAVVALLTAPAVAQLPMGSRRRSMTPTTRRTRRFRISRRMTPGPASGPTRPHPRSEAAIKAEQLQKASGELAELPAATE
jgi:hypothetical protein